MGSHPVAHLAFCAQYPRHYGTLRACFDIDGWLGYKEAVYLYEAARSIDRQDPTVVEIGTWLGRSAVVLGKALQDRQHARVICIDPFNADGDRGSRRVYERIQRSIPQTLEEACWHNIRKNGVDGVVHLIKGYSHDIVSSWTQPIDLLFIDGNHEYPAVRRDFDDWARFLVSGGLLVMDDASPASRKVHKGPNQVVRESVTGHPDWHAGVHVGTLYSARKR